MKQHQEKEEKKTLKIHKVSDEEEEEEENTESIQSNRAIVHKKKMSYIKKKSHSFSKYFFF